MGQHQFQERLERKIGIALDETKTDLFHRTVKNIYIKIRRTLSHALMRTTTHYHTIKNQNILLILLQIPDKFNLQICTTMREEKQTT